MLAAIIIQKVLTYKTLNAFLNGTPILYFYILYYTESALLTSSCQPFSVDHTRPSAPQPP